MSMSRATRSHRRSTRSLVRARLSLVRAALRVIRVALSIDLSALSIVRAILSVFRKELSRRFLNLKAIRMEPVLHFQSRRRSSAALPRFGRAELPLCPNYLVSARLQFF